MNQKQPTNLIQQNCQKNFNIVKSKTTDETNLLKEFDVFFNFSFDKGRLKSFVIWFLKTYGESKTIGLLEKLKEIGFGYATRAGISLGIDDLRIPPQKTQLLLKADTKTSEGDLRYIKGEITAVERLQNFMNVWHETSENLKKEVVNNFEATDILNPVYMMAFSGARGNLSQVRQLVGMRGLMADPQGQIIDFPIRSNFREGLTLTEYVISTYGARKGIVDTALRTANAGYLTRRLVDVAQHVIVSEFDCKTYRGIYIFDMKEGTKTIYPLQQRLIGRVLAEDVYSNDTKIASRNQEISKQFSEMLTNLSKKFLIRSPLTCATKTFVCQLCYGWSLATNRLVPIGEAVGVIAGQSIGEPGTQLTMRTFHTGGVFSGGISDQVTAQYNCIIEYPQAMVGSCVRTPQGEIAFLTKTGGYMILRPANYFSNTKVEKLSKINVSALNNQSINTFNVVAKVLKVPPYSLLFARNGQLMFKEQLIALLSSAEFQERQTTFSEQIVYSDREGEIYTANMQILELTVNETIRMKPGNEDVPKQLQFVTKDWSELLILAGKNYQIPVDSNLFARPGDFISSNSILNRIGWITSDNCRLEKEKQIGDGSFVSYQKDVGSGLLFFDQLVLTPTKNKTNRFVYKENQQVNLNFLNTIKSQYNQKKLPLNKLNKKNHSLLFKSRKRFYNFKYTNSPSALLKSYTLNRHFQFPLFFTPYPKFTKAILKETNLKTNKTVLNSQKNNLFYTNEKDSSFSQQQNYIVPTLFYPYKHSSVTKLNLRQNSLVKTSKIDLNPFFRTQKQLLKQYKRNQLETLPKMYSNHLIRQSLLNLPFSKLCFSKDFSNSNNVKQSVFPSQLKEMYYPFQANYYGTFPTNKNQKNGQNKIKVLKFKKFKMRKMRHIYNVRNFIFLKNHIQKIWSKKTIQMNLLKPLNFISKNSYQKSNLKNLTVPHKFLTNKILLAKSKNQRKFMKSFVFNNSDFSKSIQKNRVLNHRQMVAKQQFFVKRFQSLVFTKPILSFSVTNIYFQKYGYNFSLNLKSVYSEKRQSNFFKNCSKGEQTNQQSEVMLSFSRLKSKDSISSQEMQFSTTQTKEQRYASTYQNTYNWKPNTDLFLQWMPSQNISFNGGLFLTQNVPVNNYKALLPFSLNQKNQSKSLENIRNANRRLQILEKSKNLPNFNQSSLFNSSQVGFNQVNIFSDLIMLLKKQVLISSMYSTVDYRLLNQKKFLPVSCLSKSEIDALSPFAWILKKTKSQGLKAEDLSRLKGEEFFPLFRFEKNQSHKVQVLYHLKRQAKKHSFSLKVFCLPYSNQENQLLVLNLMNQYKHYLDEYKNKTFTDLMQTIDVSVLSKRSLGQYTTQTRVSARPYYVLDKIFLLNKTNQNSLTFQKTVTKSFKHSFLFIRCLQSYFSSPCSCKPKVYLCSVCLEKTKVLLLTGFFNGSSKTKYDSLPENQRFLTQQKKLLNKVFQKETLHVKDVLPLACAQRNGSFKEITYYSLTQSNKNVIHKFLFLNKPSHQPTFTKGGILQYIQRYTTTFFGRSDSKKARYGRYRLIFRKFHFEKNNSILSSIKTKNLLNYEKHIVKQTKNHFNFVKPLYSDQRKFAKMILTIRKPFETSLNEKLSVYHNEVLFLPQEKYKSISFPVQNKNELASFIQRKSCYFSVTKGTSLFELVNRQGKKQSQLSLFNGILKISVDSDIRPQIQNLPNRYMFNPPFGVPGLQSFWLQKPKLYSTSTLSGLYKNPLLKYSSLLIFSRPSLLKKFNSVKAKPVLNLPISQTKGLENLKTKEKLAVNNTKNLQRLVKSELTITILNSIILKLYNSKNNYTSHKKLHSLMNSFLQKPFVNQTKFLGHFIFRKKPNYNYFTLKGDLLTSLLSSDKIKLKKMNMKFSYQQIQSNLIPKLVDFEPQNKVVNIEVQQGWIYFSCFLSNSISLLEKEHMTSYAPFQINRTNINDITYIHESILNPGKTILENVSFDRTHVHTKCILLNKVNMKFLNKEDFIHLQKEKNCQIPFTKIEKIIQNKKCRFKPPIFAPLKLPFLEGEKSQTQIKKNIVMQVESSNMSLEINSKDTSQTQIALLILPMQHKILPNNYYYKRQLYRGQKNTNKVSSVFMKKNYFSNYFNKQKSDQKCLSSYPGIDTQFFSNFKLPRLRRKKSNKILTTSTAAQRGWNFKKSKKNKLFKKDESHLLAVQSKQNVKNLHKQKLMSFLKHQSTKSKNIQNKTNLVQFTPQIYYSAYPIYFNNFLLRANFSKDFYYTFNKVDINIHSNLRQFLNYRIENFNPNSYSKQIQRKTFLNILRNDTSNKSLAVSMAGKFAFYANQRFAANFWTNQGLKNLMKPNLLSISQMFSIFPVFRNTILSNSFNYLSKNQVLGFTSFYSPLNGEVIPSQTNIWLKNRPSQTLVLGKQNLFSLSLEFKEQNEQKVFKENNLKQILLNKHEVFLKSEKISNIIYETPVFKQNEIVLEHNDKLYKVKNIPVGYAQVFKPLRLGFVLKYGSPINPESGITRGGQIIHMSSRKITLRSAQIFLASSQSILHVKPGEFIYPNAAILTLPYQTLKTGDIVQGIPKVEQYFEARETKAGRLFSGSLPNLVHSLFKRYYSFLPRDLAVRKSILKIQQILVDGVQRVYRSQGVDIIDKHLEVIVRQMTSRVQIVHPGETAFFPGELVDLTFIELINPYLLKPIKYAPIILGITRASLEVDSFLSAASFQHTVKILSKAALYRKKDFLKGLKENLITANLIRAGTGYFLYNKKL